MGVTPSGSCTESIRGVRGRVRARQKALEWDDRQTDSDRQIGLWTDTKDVRYMIIA